MQIDEASRATRYIHKQHLRIRNLTALGILLTGLLTGLATAVPFYYASRSDIESFNQLQAESLANALHHQLELFQGITRQLGSRSETRRRLEAYLKGEETLDDLSAFTTPRLADAMAREPAIAGIMRLGPEDEPIARLGKVPQTPRLMESSSQGYPCRFHLQEGDDILIQACAPILDDNGERIGRDLVYFHVDPLVTLLSRGDRFNQEAHLRLFEAKGEQVLGLTPEGPSLDGIDAPRDDAGGRVTLDAPLGDNGWFLHVELPSQSFRDEAMMLLVWPALASLLLALAGSWLGSRALMPLMTRVASLAQRLVDSDKELRQAASVFRHAHEAIAITDAEQRLIDVNPAFTRLLGYDPETVRGEPLLDLIAARADTPETLAAGSDCLAHRDAWQGEVRYRRAGGGLLTALQTISVVRNEAGETLRYIHIFNDITAQKVAEAEVQHRALHDGLTGLPNRLHLDQHLAQGLRLARREGHGLAVLFLDLDHFKEVNDRLGHAAGDDLLRAVTERLRGAMREADFLARIGGDEFVAVLTPLRHGEASAIAVADNLIHTLSEPFPLRGETITIGVSVGIALYPEDGEDGPTLVQAADAAMYRAKANGRNTWRRRAALESRGHA
ncbi:MAG: diguanylate cyclase domain-containing protein [Halomonas sp.]